MTLEDPAVLKEKNRKRLRDVVNSFFAVGVNVTSPSKLKNSLRIITLMLIISGWTSIYGHLAYIRRYSDSILVMAESIFTLLQTLISLIKLKLIIFVHHRFQKFLRKVETHELVDQIPLLTEENQYNRELRMDAVKILDDCWKNARRQFIFYVFACSSTIGYYFFAAIAKNTYNSIVGNTNHTNVLAFPTLFPFWEDKMNEFPYYPILTCVVGSGAYVAGLGAISFDGVFIIFALHGVALFRILKKMIVFTTSPMVPKELRMAYLRECIHHYERTHQYCVELNNLYLHISLVQFLLSLIILGVVMFQGAFGLEQDFMIFMRTVLYFSAALYEVVIYCLNGQYITTESESMPFAWYDCLWYNEPRNFRRLVKMMILRSNRPVYMKCSWFTTMSLPTLMSILKTSGSYFLLLRKLAF